MNNKALLKSGVEKWHTIVKVGYEGVDHIHPQKGRRYLIPIQ